MWTSKRLYFPRRHGKEEQRQNCSQQTMAKGRNTTRGKRTKPYLLTLSWVSAACINACWNAVCIISFAGQFPTHPQFWSSHLGDLISGVTQCPLPLTIHLRSIILNTVRMPHDISVNDWPHTRESCKILILYFYRTFSVSRYTNP